MDLLTLVAKIALDSSEYDKGLSNAESKAYSIGQSIGNGLNGIGKTVIGVGKAVATAATAASGVAVAITKSAVQGFAEYEQLVGGVETLFDNSADIIMGYAENAYKTAGLTANEYMTTATSFSAALLQGLEGDTQTAAEVTDMAITDMSDNVNKMGSSMESVQNAYMGFSKQNYTMLDNLKLGYGGTKKEMERLLEDAEALSGIHYDIENLSDVYQAIHVIQEEMGITGTTAKEAGETVSGSMASVKAAWSNLITGLADSNADLDKLINNVVSEAEVAFGNLLPVAEKALRGIADFIGAAAPVLVEKLPELITSVVPSVVEAASAILDALVSALPGVVSGVTPIIVETGSNLVSTVAGGISDNLLPLLFAAGDMIDTLLNGLLEATQDGHSVLMEVVNDIAGVFEENYAGWLGIGLQILTNIINGITEGLPELVNYVAEIIRQFGEAIIEYAPSLIEPAANLVSTLAHGIAEALPTLIPIAVEALTTFDQALYENIGVLVDAALELIMALAEGIVAALPNLIESAGDIIATIITTIGEKLPDILNAGVDILFMLIDGIVSAVPKLLEQIPKIIEAIKTAFTKTNWPEVGEKIINKIKEGVQKLSETIPALLKEIGEKAGEWLSNVNWKEVGSNIVKFIVAEIQFLFFDIPNLLREIGESAFKSFGEIDWKDLGIQVINGLINGIGEMASGAVEAILEVGSGLISGFKDLLGISSPSKVFEDLGGNILSGLDEGLSQTDDVDRTVVDLGELITGNIMDVVDLAAGWGESLIGNLGSAISYGISDVSSVVMDLVNNIIGTFDIDWWDLGTNITNGISNGLLNGAGSLWDAATNIASQAWNAVTGFFQVASPSKKMMWVGKMIDEGLADGIERSSDDVQGAMDSLANISAQPWNDINVSASGGRTGGTNNSIVMNIYGAVGQDVNELAEIIAEKLDTMVYQNNAAWGAA